MDNLSENKQSLDKSDGMRGAFTCLCKHPVDFFAQDVATAAQTKNFWGF